jgi:hypothetical protein
MMAPDYTHWHGTYEVARRFYSEFVPQLQTLIEKHLASPDAEKAGAAKALKARLDEVLASEDHKWSIGKMDAAEAARRKKAMDDFKARYEKAPDAPRPEPTPGPVLPPEEPRKP